MAAWLLVATLAFGAFPAPGARALLIDGPILESGESNSGTVDAPLVEDVTAVRTADKPQQTFDLWKWTREQLDKLLRTAAAVAYKKALTYFMTKIATDAATKLASGGKGQKPLFETEGWGAYLTRVGDSAAGHFIEEFAANAGLPNLCTPQFNLKLKLSLGLMNAARPPAEPACTFTQLAGNWESFARSNMDNPRRLNEMIDAQFSPNDNDLAIGFGVWSSFYSTVEGRRSENTLQRLESQGFKALTGLDGSFLTPGVLLKDITADALSPDTLGDTYLTYTGSAVADAVDAFTSTLVSKTLTRLYEKGFSALSAKPERYDWNKLEGLRSPNADPFSNRSSVNVRQEFEAFFSPTLAVGDPRLNRIDVTSQLVGEGVISPVFKTAIDRKLTVRQAIDQNLLFADGPGSTFGFTRAGTQPDANEGYAQQALTILRKYRILPVGWELAATYIGKLEQRRVFSLNDVIRGFADPDSPFFGLVDAGWVLKAPETYCRLSGPGDELVSSSVQDETITETNQAPDPKTGQYPSYQFQRRNVSRQDACVDTRSCIVEDSNGNCRAYGLCTQERPIWRFAGSECPASYDSCRTYEDGDNRTFNFLARTLDAGACGADSVGCSWFCRDYNVQSGVWACLSEGEQVRQPCQATGRCSTTSTTACVKDAECPRGEQCLGASCLATDVVTGTSCEIAYGAVSCTVPSCGAGENAVLNGSFETESASVVPAGGTVTLAANWITSDVAGGNALWSRVSGVGNQVANGTFSLRLDADGTRARLVAETDRPLLPPVSNPPYTLSGRLYSSLLFGRAYLEVVPTAGAGCSTADADTGKGQWTAVSCGTSDSLTGAKVRLVVEAVAGVNPVGTVWFDAVSVERACPLKDVTVYLESSRHDPGSKIFFDRDVTACNQEENGCRMLIPTAGRGVNLVYNSSFEAWPDPSNRFPDDSGWENISTGSVARADDGAATGQNYLRYTNTTADDSLFRTAVLPVVQPSRTYQLSLYAKSDAASAVWEARLGGLDTTRATQLQRLVAVGTGKCHDAGATPPKDTDVACRNDDDCIRGPDAPSGNTNNYCFSQLPLTTQWQRFTFEPLEAASGRSEFWLQFGATDANKTIHLDGVQLASVPARSNPQSQPYVDYAQNPVTYLKAPPEYLGCTGDPLTDHSACARFAQVCRADEVGCQRYTPTNGEPPLPAITTAADRCPRECVDYSAFSQSATFFADPIPSPREPGFLYFIARTGRQCQANYAGCEEFTNLDEVAAGGEGKGSYTYLRQCTKPDANVCRTYYTWVGSEVTGLQLKSYNLRRDVGGADVEAPDVAVIPDPERLGNCPYNGKPAPAAAPGPAAAGTCTYDTAGAPLPAGTESWDGTGCHNPADAQKNAQLNPNCREFHARNGNLYYRLLRQTVACSAECHPFRLLDTSQESCERSNGYWGVCGNDADNDGDIDPPGDTPLANCLEQGGMQLVGSSDCFMPQAACTVILGMEYEPRNECVYQAVPAESQACPAAQSGCREYRGNAGANVQTVFSDDFEDGDTVGWGSGTISSDAVSVGGHSISGSTAGVAGPVETYWIDIQPTLCGDTLGACGPAQALPCWNAGTRTCTFGAGGNQCTAAAGKTACGVAASVLAPNRSYQLKFWAKAKSAVASMTVQLTNVDCGSGMNNCKPPFSAQRVNTEWEEFTSEPIQVAAVAPDARLTFTGVNFATPPVAVELAYDFITLTQIRQYNYLVNNSWRTPDSCNTNPTIDPVRFPPPNAPQFALGCREYSTSAGGIVYLKSFEQLCRDASVGCAEYIDTQNTTSALEQTFNAGHPQSEVTVPADRPVYYVQDETKTCAAASKGCAAFGRPQLDAYGAISGYLTQYLINDPERYGTTLCQEDQVSCKEYVSPQEGTVYFRDPGARTCEYRQIPNRQDFGWFITASRSTVPDCPTATYQFGLQQPGKTCQGGDLDGQLCASDGDCSFKVCRGGINEGARCADSTDCVVPVCVGGARNGEGCGNPANCPGGACTGTSTGVCEPQAGTCRSWVGQCSAEYASCTTYVDPLSDPQAGVLPNGNFEGFFRSCSFDDQTVCRSDADCQDAIPGEKRCTTTNLPCTGLATDCNNSPELCQLPTCSVSELNSWTAATAITQHLRGGGVNSSSALRILATTDPVCVGPGIDGNPCSTGCLGGTCSGDRSIRQSVPLQAGTLYTLTASVKNSAANAAIMLTTVGASNRAVFAQFDHSVAIQASGILAPTGNTVLLPVGGVSDGSYQRFVGRFFVTETDRAVAVKLLQPATFDNVDIKPTGIYRYLSSSLDRSSCNGAYDPAQGCVLVNDTSDAALRYSTAATRAGAPPQACQPQQCAGGAKAGSACLSDQDCAPGGLCRPGTCDSNLLVKVTPDRTCATWLECVSSREQVNYVSGTRQNFCQQLATCDRLDQISGRCSSFPTEELEPLQFNAGSVEQAQYYSGLAKVGFQWDADTQVPGYFPYGAMTQRKVCVAGNLDAKCLEDADCNTPGNRDGRCQPVLQVGKNATEDLIYESCRIYPRANSPRWGALGPVDTGDKPARWIITDVLNPFLAPEFGDNRTPRLLEDASECHYVQGRTELQGLYGFCVEKDPRSPYRCLNWLPVDELTGGWIGITGWRDNLRAPLYFCTESATLETRRPKTIEVNKCFQRDFFDIDAGDLLVSALGGLVTGGNPAGPILARQEYSKQQAESKSCGPVFCPPGYIGSVSDSSCGTYFEPGLRCRWRCEPDTTDLYRTDASGLKWYDWIPRVNAQGAPTKKHLMFCPKCGGEGTVVWDPEDPSTIRGWDNFSREEQQLHPYGWARVCEKFVSVVASDGVNRGWKERLETIQDFTAADYLVPRLNYKLEDLVLPFGSIGRSFQGDPVRWPLVETRIRAADFANPLWPAFPGGEAGQIYYDKFFGRRRTSDPSLETIDSPPVQNFHVGRELIRRMFASSFGDWRWNGGGYEPYAVAQQYCNGGPRDGQDCTGTVDADGDGALDGDDAMCADSYNQPPSTCNKADGFCTYVGDGKPHDAPDIACGSDSTCAAPGNLPFCAYGHCGSFADGDELNDTGKPCRENTGVNGCPIGETCSIRGTIYGRCVSLVGPGYRREGIACLNQSACDTSPSVNDGNCVDFDTNDKNNDTTWDGKHGYCSHGVNGGQACEGVGVSCSPPEQQPLCVGRCSAGSANPDGRCTADSPDCRINGACEKTNAWTPPANRCQDNVRPSRFSDNPAQDPAGAGDWCGVSPEIFNAKLENAQSPVYYGVNQVNVTLSFNVKVDNDQLPVRKLVVQWDRAGRDPAVSDNTWRSGMRDKRDPRDPFQLNHTYQYEEACDTGKFDADPTTLSGFCEFQIGIQVRDNWCWCAQLPVGVSAGVNTGDNECNDCPSSAWVEPPGTLVRVCSAADAAKCGVVGP